MALPQHKSVAPAPCKSETGLLQKRLMNLNLIVLMLENLILDTNGDLCDLGTIFDVKFRVKECLISPWNNFFD